jgi:hypothetical protein
VQAIEMSLMPEILGRSELHIDALGLEDHTDLAAQTVGVPGNIKSHDLGSPAYRNHQGGQDAKQRRLSTAIRSQQSEEFGLMHIEGDTVQRGAITITMHDILHRNNRGPYSEVGLRASYSKWSFRSHRLFYDETLASGLRSDRFSSSTRDSLLKRCRHLPPHLNRENDSCG